MSDVLPSERLDRIRRRLAAGVIRLEHIALESFVEFTDALGLLEELIAIEKLKELNSAATRPPKLQPHRNRKAHLPRSGRASGDGQPESAVAEDGDPRFGCIERGANRQSSDAGMYRKAGHEKDHGGIDVLAGRTDTGTAIDGPTAADCMSVMDE